MLQIKQICKQYRTGNLVQKALDNVSLNLRENEFVAILGPSGSGKTTLLNIIGGLDRYDSGDVIINGISTKKYKDRDWDSYRNHTIGFVFQSYNLIPHQTVLSNVELALTISGVSKSERRKRAKRALEQVGLGEQLHKRPSQMSGGQMQRVAIARALVNDPDILLADEPTGALDSETSVQVMELLKEVAKDRLVVMVTHNPELARQYATRIVQLKDGKIRSDSHPFELSQTSETPPVHKNMGKASMSLFTALSLSFNNLRTKKARTILTSFAGSIGIIGIALILAISNGVNGYIQTLEEETLSEYPLQIQSTTMDFSSMMAGMMGGGSQEESGEVTVTQMLTNLFSRVEPNDLESLKSYFDSGASGIEEYAHAIEYSYDVAPQIYRQEEDSVRQVNPDHSFTALGIGTDSNSFMSSMMSTDVFYQMPANSDLYEGQYEVKAGRWPENYNECVVVLTSQGSVSDFMLYTLGLRDSVELDEMIQQFLAEEQVTTPEDMGSYQYNDFLGITFKLVNAADYYEYDETYSLWRDKSEDQAYLQNLVTDGEDITVVGVVQPAQGTTAAMLSTGIAYPASLTQHVMEQAAASPIVRQQLEQPEVNVLTGNSFGEDNSQNQFDMSSLFTVDQQALQNAFTIDSSALELNLSDAMQQEGGSLNLELPQVDLGEILGQLDLSVSPQAMAQLAGGLMEGYQSYAAQHPEADLSRLAECFSEYLQTPQGQQVLQDGIEDILASGVTVTVSPEQLQALLQDLLAGFQEYAAANGWTDPAQMNEYLTAYLQTSEAQQQISDGITNLLDIDALQQQVADALQGTMSSYTETVTQAIQSQITSALGQAADQMGSNLEAALAQSMSQMGSAIQVDPEAFAGAIQMNMSQEELAQLLSAMMSGEDASYSNNLASFGYADENNPSEISIYPYDFEGKAAITDILDQYNSRMEALREDSKVISYTDLVGTLMSSVTQIVDTISYVLVAFVAISLVVSSIMIGVITYISVLERKKEIGILRAIGASKHNISQVFNAETFIIGLCAGLIGIGLTLLLLIPGNALIHSLAGTTDINASLPVVSAIILIALSVVLTLLGGLIPSRKAAKSDPVTALRAE